MVSKCSLVPPLEFSNKNDKYIEQVIKNSPKVVAIHSEDENMLVDRRIL